MGTDLHGDVFIIKHQVVRRAKNVILSMLDSHPHALKGRWATAEGICEEIFKVVVASFIERRLISLTIENASPGLR